MSVVSSLWKERRGQCGLVSAHLAERGAPLVAALQRYVTANDEPPASLDALVPEFIAQIPDSEMAAYPEYQYELGTRARLYADNPWVLYVEARRGVFAFDTFMYWPRQNHEEYTRQPTRRIQDWVHVVDLTPDGPAASATFGRPERSAVPARTGRNRRPGRAVHLRAGVYTFARQAAA